MKVLGEVTQEKGKKHVFVEWPHKLRRGEERTGRDRETCFYSQHRVINIKGKKIRLFWAYTERPGQPV